MAPIGNYSMNSSQYGRPVQFRADGNSVTKLVTKPIDTVESAVSTVTDTFEPENEEHKKSYKTAIRVGSTVLVLASLVALINPKFSTKLIERLKTKSAKAANKAKTSDSLSGKWNKFKNIAYDGVVKTFQIMNNGNSAKDAGFKWLCSKAGFMKNIHNSITKAFDKISKHTVVAKYSKANKRIDNLNKIFEQYKDRLSAEDKKIFEQKIAEIKNLQKYLSEENINSRLQNQEALMADLEKDTISRMNAFRKNIFDKNVKKGDKFNDMTTFWAEESIKPQKEKLIQEGEEFVSELAGNKNGKKGLYTEIFELVSPHLKEEERLALQDGIKKSAKKLTSANKSETVEYFDKKRDLVLGSAPTDIVTALFSLGACGVALGTADSKEQRMSRTVSGIIPAICGIGTSIALTAMLVSGGLSIALGGISSVVLSGIGSITSRALFPKQPKLKEEVKNV